MHACNFIILVKANIRGKSLIHYSKYIHVLDCMNNILDEHCLINHFQLFRQTKRDRIKTSVSLKSNMSRIFPLMIDINVNKNCFTPY